jgi:hypothetical protein
VRDGHGGSASVRHAGGDSRSQPHCDLFGGNVRGPSARVHPCELLVSRRSERGSVGANAVPMGFEASTVFLMGGKVVRHQVYALMFFCEFAVLDGDSHALVFKFAAGHTIRLRKRPAASRRCTGLSGVAAEPRRRRRETGGVHPEGSRWQMRTGSGGRTF